LLDLGFNGIDDTGVRTLARSAALSRLQALYLPTWLNDTRRITWDGVGAIAESPFLAGLVELDLSGNAVNDAGVRAIAKSGSLARLQLLRLQQNLIGDAGVAALVRSDLLRRILKRDPRLDLRDNAIGAAGAAALAASPDLHLAERLDLRRNYLGDRGATLLATSPNISGLRSLLLARNQIGDIGALAIAKALERNSDLRSLDISGNRLTRRGVEALRTATRDRVAVDFSSNGTEPSTPLAASPALAPPVADDPNLAELKRRVTHPTRRER
jgi:Leucine-rich repeat (LRR) protein